MMRLFDRLILVATALAFCVVVLGAYVRLADAGLGCPDWPGCYGHLTVPQDEAALSQLEQAYPDKPLEAHKAWKEMIHRYLAGTLGLLVAAICALTWRHRRQGAPVIWATGLLLLVILQAALGMWTVTLLLKPAVVSAHLLGGMATLAMLVWMASRRVPVATAQQPGLRPWVVPGLVILAMQIFLGGWTSANYAALACGEFPLCQGGWLPAMDFAQAFRFARDLGETVDGQPLPVAALVAIHWMHRVGALVTFLYLGWLAIRVARCRELARLAALLVALLLVQASLGVVNVLYDLPLPAAVAHNAVAALLLILLVVLHSKTAVLSERESGS